MARPYIGGTSASIETLAASTTLTEADTGKTYICTQAGAYDITIPAGTVKGWTAKLGDTNTAITAESDKVTFDASNAGVGDWIEVISDGSNYYVTHAAVADAGAEHSG